MKSKHRFGSIPRSVVGTFDIFADSLMKHQPGELPASDVTNCRKMNKRSLLPLDLWGLLSCHHRPVFLLPA